MAKHWAVMNDTGEVIASGDTFGECQRAAFATRRWVDPNTGEFMPAGSVCPYRIQSWEPVALAEFGDDAPAAATDSAERAQ